MESGNIPCNPASMVVSGSTLYASFVGYGLWKYDGASWSQDKFRQSGKYGRFRFTRCMRAFAMIGHLASITALHGTR